jgi:glycosyltransferase involved in cell wall biosynthesis
VYLSTTAAEVRRDARATLSIVIPLYNEADTVDELLRRLGTVIAGLQPAPPAYEIICVDDGSRDETLARLRSAAEHEPRLRIISLSRNFGHQIASTAGLDSAFGDAVILMDGDLQDPPELIARFIELFREGYDVVYATRRRRAGESRFKVWTAALFYRITRRLTNVAIPLDTGDFRLMSQRVVTGLRSMRERHRFIRGLVAWSGYRQTGVDYDREARFAGSTKFSTGKMLRFALDGITAFSEIPLRFASYFGFIVSVFAFIYAVVVLVLNFRGQNLPGYTSMMIALLFLGGVQLIGVGILGEYIGRIYNEIKDRPLYLVAEATGAPLAGTDAAPSTLPVTR